ncbi:hypothetical protein [Nonomuraea fuscirosea]|uniref:hypothetical protein n=1 Tax=Nonomuraea fuscirosea TaxID=1291556 RepID=UPI003425B9E2
MSKRDTYTIIARRSDDWWALTVSGPGLKRSYHTQVKRLEQAEEMARDLVVTMLDADVFEINADFDVTVADEEVATEMRASAPAFRSGVKARVGGPVKARACFNPQCQPGSPCAGSAASATGTGTMAATLRPRLVM